MLSQIKHAPLPAPPRSFNLVDYVFAQGRATPNKTALQVIGGQSWTFEELERDVRATGAGLLAQGLAPKDRLLMRLGNGAAFPLTFLGAIAVGIVPVPTSAQLTGPEITAIAQDLAPAAVIAEAGIALPDGPWPQLTPTDLTGASPGDFNIGDPDRPAYIIFTSGTGGRARGVVHAHRAVWARQMMFDGWYGLRPDDRMLHAGAFNWTYTLGTGLLDPWTKGATALIPAPGTPAQDLPGLVADHEATLLAGAPGVFRQILKTIPLPMPTLRHVFSAGERLPEQTADRWRDATGTEIYEAFGLSECSTFLSSAPGGVPRLSAQLGRHVAMLDDEGHPAPRGTAGAVAVWKDDPGLMVGYLGGDLPLINGWFLTGDMGVMDDSGRIDILGRRDDVITAGGYRISPTEVEAVLEAHPDVAEAAVTELRVGPETTVIGAFVTGDAADPERLTQFCASRLARYKQPRIITPVQTLPRNPNGKLLRRALRAAYEARDDKA